LPPLARLTPYELSRAGKARMGALRLYRLLSGGLVIARIVTLAIWG
jgi:hypothetical protein